MLGTSIEVPSLDGPKRVTIPPGVKSPAKVRLKGLGVPDIAGGPPGDLYIEVKIDLPKRLTEKQKALFEELRKEGL